MTKITLGGSRWLHDTTAKWRAQQQDAKLDLDKQRLAVNKPTPAEAAREAARDTTSVLYKLHAKGQLDNSKAVNDILYHAGFKYYGDWFLAGLNGISAIDYNRVGGGGDGDTMSEFQEARGRSFHRAGKELGPKYKPVVDAVVLEELPISAIRHLTGYADKNAASAVVMERLGVGLRVLALFYGVRGKQ